VPMLARHSVTSDGANFGVNGKYSQYPEPKPKPLGNLATPFCAPMNEDKCMTTSLWWAGRYELAGDGSQIDLPVEFGVLPLTSFGDVIKHPAHGVIGALVIGPKGSRRCTPDDVREQAADRATDISATMCDSEGNKLYRDFVMVLQDAVDAKINGDRVANLKGAEEPDDYGIKAVNYRSEPLWGRRGGDPSIDFGERNEFDYAGVLSSKEKDEVAGYFQKSRCHNGTDGLNPNSQVTYLQRCDPETPVFVATAGSEVRMRVVHPGGHTRQQAISLAGHHWNPYPWNEDSSKLLSGHEAAVKDAWVVQGAFNSVGPMMSANLLIRAGGEDQVPMDYLWRSDASFLFDGGIWGILRVLPKIEMQTEQ